MQNDTSNHQEQAWLLREKYHGIRTTDYEADCRRLAAGEPLAYLIGYQPFLATTIWLDSRPLIPRTETEYWVEKLILNYRATGHTPRQILDLCAGSGAIGVALAVAFPAAHVTFSELEANHLPTIEKNCQYNQLPSDRYTLFTGDLFEPLPDTSRFDVIVSNPPYIDPSLDRVSASVRAFEPAIALYGGSGGIALLNKIIADARPHLTNDGQLWLEHEPEQAALLAEYSHQYGFRCHTHQDQFGNQRYSQLVLQ
jgi:release factor glutamine methyltransferase